MSRLLHSQTVLLFINISVLRDYLYESICPSNLMERPATAREIHVSAIYTMSANVVLRYFIDYEIFHFLLHVVSSTSLAINDKYMYMKTC